MPATETRSQRLKQVVKTIRVLTREKKMPPTVRELADALGRSVSPVHKDLWTLRRDGAVTWEDNKPRTLRVVQ